MKKSVGIVCAASVVVLMFASSLLAHHSESMLDKENLTKLRGTIVKHDFVNPHAKFTLKVKNASGSSDLWDIQATPPGALRSVGWTKDSLKPGDEIDVVVYACKDGRPCASWVMVRKSNGEILPLPDFKKRFLGEYMVTHGDKISKEDYALYKTLVEGAPTNQIVEAPKTTNLDAAQGGFAAERAKDATAAPTGESSGGY
jgi:hypothetical protein